MSETKNRCRAIFSKVMEVTPEQVEDASNPDTLDSWDSLSHVQLIAALEKEFSIAISPEEGIELESFADVCTMVQGKLG